MKLEDNWSPDPEILNHIKKEFQKENKDMNKKGIFIGNFFGDGNYSANEIIKEIENGSETGKFIYGLAEEIYNKK